MNVLNYNVVKSGMAKLLANENITVRHTPGVTTAAFDLQNRVVHLPIWKDISNDLYDMLIVHEVGHALFTNKARWEAAIKKAATKFYKDPAVAKSAESSIQHFLNVIEDARIDKLQKRRYPGSKINYSIGYKELLDRDFFGLAEKDINTLSFIDRANIYFKGGMTIGIKFDAKEQGFIDRMSNAETFDDVEAILMDVYDYSKDEQNPNSPKNTTTVNVKVKCDNPSKGKKGEQDKGEKGEEAEAEIEMEASEGDESEEDEGEDSSEDGSEGSAEGDEEQEGTGKSSDSGEGEDEGDEEGDQESDGSGDSSKSEIRDDVVEKSENSSSADGAGAVDLTIFVPRVISEENAQKSMEQMVETSVSTRLIYNKLPSFKYDQLVDDFKKVLADFRDFKKTYSAGQNNAWEDIATRLNKLRKSENDTINYMVKEFERRKAAELYSRAMVSKTGIIDTNKIHAYTMREDVFKRHTTIPEGKNHGFVMLLDWSSSMEDNLEQTLTQLFILVWFCKKLHIPFDVYTFRSPCGMAENYLSVQNNPSEDGVIIANKFKLRNIISSRMNNEETNLAMQALLFMALRTGSPRDSLGSTPLNAAILAFDKIVNDFQKKNRVQVVNTIVLTDGASDPTLVRDATWDRNQSGCTCVLDDPKTKFSYTWDRYNSTKTFLKFLKNRTHCNLIGFFLSSGGALAYHKNFDQAIERKENQKTWREEGFATALDAGYDEYYILDTAFMKRAASNNSSKFGLKVNSNTTEEDLQRNFNEFLNKRKVARVLLNRFVEKISKEAV